MVSTESKIDISNGVTSSIANSDVTLISNNFNNNQNNNNNNELQPQQQQQQHMMANMTNNNNNNNYYFHHYPYYQQQQQQQFLFGRPYYAAAPTNMNNSMNNKKKPNFQQRRFYNNNYFVPYLNFEAKPHVLFNSKRKDENNIRFNNENNLYSINTQNNTSILAPKVIITTSSSSTENDASTAANQQELEDKQQNDLTQKTPMFLINELARFNKIQLQYLLEDETGPAHNKTFFVKLKLGEDEEYKASGTSIKKAQQAAAKIALENSKYEIIQKRKKEINIGLNLTPTVQLNALAVKFGYEPKYVFTNLVNKINRNNYTNFTTNEYKPFNYPKYPQVAAASALNVTQLNYNKTYNQVTYGVTLHIGDKSFYAESFNRQKAKHGAANQGLQYLNSLKALNENNNSAIIESNINNAAEATTVEVVKKSAAELNSVKSDKSEISLVQEQAKKMNLRDKYELIQESGPSHIKKYTTRCTVGEIQTIGEGKSKKESKKNAAIKMLEEFKLKNLLILESTTESSQNSSNCQTQQKQADDPNDKKKNKKRVKNIIKAIKENPDYGKGTLNPICRLIQIQQANKGAEPVYQLIEEKKKFRRQEFTIQVSVGENKCVGSGSSKCKAKQNAAQAMLVQLGYQPINQQQQQQQEVQFSLQPKQNAVLQIPKPALKTQSNKIQRVNNVNSDNVVVVEKKVKFVDLKDETDKDEDKKEVKATVVLGDNKNNNNNKEANRNLMNRKYKEKQQQQLQKFNQTLYTACLISNDLLTKGSSETADSICKQKNEKNENQEQLATSTVASDDIKSSTVDMSYKDKLVYIASLLDFDVKFQSLTKKDSIRSYVSISILSDDDKPMTGDAKTSFDSQNEAALCALKYLAEKYINKINIEKLTNDIPAVSLIKKSSSESTSTSAPVLAEEDCLNNNNNNNLTSILIPPPPPPSSSSLTSSSSTASENCEQD